jgi:hypothetical protein
MRPKFLGALALILPAILLPAILLGEEVRLPALFVPNQGEWPEPVRYVAETPRLRAGFLKDRVLFTSAGERVELRFEGASAGVELEGADPMGAHANFFTGSDPGRWRTRVPIFRKLIYRGIYPGVDAGYSSNGWRLKAEFVVAAGSDPGQIRLEYTNAGVSLREGGALLVKSEGSQLLEEAPVAYQEAEGGQVPVAVEFVLLDSHTVGFRLGAYDSSRPLIIDPVISYSTYLGGSDLGAVTGAVVDSGGYLYVTGWTAALNFPIAGPAQGFNAGSVDAFVAKFSTNGSSLIYATYIGGSSDDRGAAIAVDSSGQAWITGYTTSSNFPQAPNQGLTLGGGRDAFVLKLNALGNTILFSRYLGGTNWDTGTAIRVDSGGNAYVAGDTLSANFPVASALQPANGGKTDAFVTKFNSSGGIVWSTFLGGASDEHAGGIAVDSSGNVYVGGGTGSANFPTAAPFQPALKGAQDAFVSKIAAAGSPLIYSTYLGGSGGTGAYPEQVNGIAVDSTGAAYVAGVTSSADFPVTSGSFQQAFAGVQDGFVSKLNAAGSALVYSTYLGAYGTEWISAIALDSSLNAYVGGFTSSATFPVQNPLQAFKGGYDALVTELNPNGSAAVFSTPYGGTGLDAANAIALDANANIFVGGQTSSADFPLANAIQTYNSGGSIGWVARLGVTAAPPQVPSTVSVSPASGSGTSVTLTAVYSHPAGATSLTAVSLLMNATPSPDFGCNITFTRSSNQFTLFNDTASSGGFNLSPGSASKVQNDQCILSGTGSSVSLSGTTLTVTVVVSFVPGFQGAKTVYLAAADASSSTGWVARGSWTVTIPSPQPSVGSVSWSASTFSFVFGDSQSVNNITGVGMLFSTSTSQVNACSIYWDRQVNVIQLMWDNVASSDRKPFGSSALLQNSQCIVGNVTATVSGLSLIVSVDVMFKSSFTGNKFIYGYTADGYLNTGWVQLSPYTVTVGGVPVANSAVPSSGSGPSQRFTFTVSDQGGAYFIKFVGILFNSSVNLNNACYIQYDPNANVLSVAYDIAANGATPVVPGSNGIATSSQCLLKAANSQIIYTQTSVVVTVDVTFTASFAGNKTIYLYAGESAANTGWVAVGNWTASGGTPSADAMSPSSGAGNWQTFTFTASDSASQLNINGMQMLFTAGSPANIVNQCHLVYNRDNGTIGLYDDAHTVLSTKGIGYSTLLENSQCWVGYTIMTASGNSVKFLIELQFKPAFNGAKSVYLQANEVAASSGWVSRGTWTVQ